MTVSKYFNNFNRKSHQNLIENLNIQAIKHKGFDVYYLPRTLQKEDLIYGEDVLSKFSDYYVVEMYLKTDDGFKGRGDMFKKFGLEIDDQATLQVSRKRFAEEIGESISPARPREGDLLFFPLNGSLTEIKFVHNEQVFYQLGEVYLWEIDVRAYVYSHEEIKTGIDDIDSDMASVQFEITLNFDGGSGTFIPGETVTQSATNISTSATVVEFGSTLTITNVVGQILENVNIIGEISGATYVVASVHNLNILQNASAQNKPIQDATPNVISFSEKNPFGDLAGEDEE